MRPLQLAPISGRRSPATPALRWTAASLALHTLVLLPSFLGLVRHPAEEERPTEELVFLAPLLPKKVPSGDIEQQEDGVSGVPIHFGTFTESVVGAGEVPGVVVGRTTGSGATETPVAHDIAAPPTPDSAATGDENIYQAVDVDREVLREATAAAPIYPEQLRLTGVQGGATAEFVVDTLGLVEDGSFHIIGATHPLFAAAVRDAVPGMRFRPAVRAGHLVRQQVLQSFQFVLAQQPTQPSVPVKPVAPPTSSFRTQ